MEEQEQRTSPNPKSLFPIAMFCVASKHNNPLPTKSHFNFEGDFHTTVTAQLNLMVLNECILSNRYKLTDVLQSKIETNDVQMGNQTTSYCWSSVRLKLHLAQA